MVPLKHTALVEISPDGKTTMYFRTQENYARFLEKKLSLPGIGEVSAQEWLQTIPTADRADRISNALVYSGVIFARGAPMGREFDSRSITYIKSLSQTLTPSQKQQIRRNIREQVQHPGGNPAPYDFVFQTLGIERTAGASFR